MKPIIFKINFDEIRKEMEIKEIVENYTPIKNKRGIYPIDIKGLYEELEDKKVGKKKSFNELILSEEYFLVKRDTFNNNYDYSKIKAKEDKGNNYEESQNNSYEEGKNALKNRNSSLINSTNSYVSISISELKNSSINSNTSSTFLGSSFKFTMEV